MLREPQKTTIQGYTYRCKPLPGWEGVRLFFEMVSVVGEPAMHMISRAFSEEDVGNADAGQVIGAGVYSFFAKFDTETGIRIMKILFAEVDLIKTDGTAVALNDDAEFNQHFTGGALEAIKVFAWAMQVNFRDFLDESRLSGPVGGFLAAIGKVFSLQTSPQPSEPSSSTQTAASA